MTTYRIDAGAMNVLKYEDQKEALRMGNFGCLVSSEDELINGPVLMATMIELHKRATDSAKGPTFKDRTEIAKHLWPLLEKLSIMGRTFKAIVAQTPRKIVTPPTQPTAQIERGVVMAKAVKKTPAKPVNGKPVNGKKAATVARKSEYSGKKIFLTKKTNGENVRKAGTGGHAAMEIVRKNAGITYEDFVAKGGARNHLAWDLERGNYELK